MTPSIHPALQLLDRGYADLVCVVPPHARLAPTTSLKPNAKGKVPGIRRIDGLWVGYPFLAAAPPTRQTVEKWVDWQANIGMAGEQFPGLDIDVDHPQLSRAVESLALKFFGAAPVRTGKGSRKLLVYRTDEAFTRMAADITFGDETHTVEVLGHGRQYLVAGRHPSGVDYAWTGRPLWEWDPADLPVLTPEKVAAFFAHIQEKLGGRASVRVQGDGSVREDVPTQESLLAPSILALRDVVAAVPNDIEDRDGYIRMGYAIKAAAGGSDEGLDVFQEWASRWSGGANDPDVVDADWRRMHPPFAAGWGWLVEQADAAGLLSAQVEFEADPLATPPKESKFNLLGGVIDFTDTWVVSRLIAVLVKDLRYVPEAARWHVWNGYAWASDRTNLAEHKVRQALVAISSQIYERAEVTPDDKLQARLYQFAHQLQSRGALTKAVPELQAHPALTLTVDDFDSDPWLLNTPEGVVDLQTGKVQSNDPALNMSKTVAVAPRPGDHIRWSAFLAEATGGDKEMEKFLQRLVGYSLTGSTQEQSLAFVHGPPLTGKSVFIECVGGLLGTYHATAAADTFAQAKGDRHPTDLARLAGSRLVTASETQEGRAWDTQRVKSLTGGDVVSARFMRQDFFEFRPTFNILIVGNHEPEIDGVDEAMFRRLHIVPFIHRPAEVDRLLGERLREEWPQIMAWAIEGCQAWLREGLNPPPAVQARTKKYRDEEDPVGQFLEERCHFDPEAEVTRTDLYHSWARWCHGMGEEPGSLKQMKRKFAPKETELGFADARLGSGFDRPRGYRGITLKEEEDLL